MSWHATALSILSVVRAWFLNPLLYAGFLLAFWDLRRTSTFERKFFGIRATRPLRLTIIRGLQGLVVGIIISALLTACGVVVETWEIGAVTVLSIILAAIQLRFVSPVYSVAVISVAAWVVKDWVPAQQGFLGKLLNHLVSFHALSWLALLSGVLLAEAALVYFVGRNTVAPVVTVSKRGRSIGALWIQLAFLVPVIVPTTGTLWSQPGYAQSTVHLLWTSALATFGIIGLPTLVGFSGLFDNLHPKRAIRETALVDVLSAIVAAVGVYLGQTQNIDYAVFGPWVVLVVREFFRWWLDHRQSLSDPVFTPAEEGVTVLSVLAHSWAARLGITPGDTIRRVNGVPVHSQYDLHFALGQNPAYAKLDVVDSRGEIRFVNHTVYEGERSQLGLIFVPDSQSPRFLKAGGSGLLQSLYAQLGESTAPMTTASPTVMADSKTQSNRAEAFELGRNESVSETASTTVPANAESKNGDPEKKQRHRKGDGSSHRQRRKKSTVEVENNVVMNMTAVTEAKDDKPQD